MAFGNHVFFCTTIIIYACPCYIYVREGGGGKTRAAQTSSSKTQRRDSDSVGNPGIDHPEGDITGADRVASAIQRSHALAGQGRSEQVLFFA